MVRRLYSVLYFLATIPVAITLIVAYLTIPIWLIVWVFTGWWIYPPGNAFISNVMSWLLVRSASKKITDNKEYYALEDYQEMRMKVRTQSFD